MNEQNKEKSVSDLFLEKLLTEITTSNLSPSEAIERYNAFKNTLNETENKAHKQKEEKASRRGDFSLYVRDKLNGAPVYYVEYKITIDGKKTVVKKSTNQTDYFKASEWAKNNKESVIQDYKSKRFNLIEILEIFYKDNSPYKDEYRIVLTDAQRKKYDTYINTYVLDYFQPDKKKPPIKKTPMEVDKTDIERIRDLVLGRGKAPSTSNDVMTALRHIFNYLEKNRVIKSNPMESKLTKIKSNYEKKERHAYPESKLKGFFQNAWEKEDYYFYMLCLVGFFTGMRNSEIYRIQPEDFYEYEGMIFLNVRGEKTENAIRKLPIHPFCYDKIQNFIKENNINNGDRLFNYDLRMDKQFTRANEKMGVKLGYTPEQLKEKNITFYGLRHLYKTMIVSAGITKDNGEYLMGHSHKGGVDKTYIDFNSIDLKYLGEKVIKMFDERI